MRLHRIFRADGPALHGRYVHAQQPSPACSPIMQAKRTCTRVRDRWWRTRDRVRDRARCRRESPRRRRIDDHKPLPAAPTPLHPLLLPLQCALVPCCMPKRAVAPRRGTQWTPHGHVQSTGPCGATDPHNQHQQRSLRGLRRPSQNDDLEIGLYEPRLRSFQAEAMNAMQAAASWPSAPQKPTSIIGREITNATNVSHVTT